jgi:hypothetical protein
MVREQNALANEMFDLLGVVGWFFRKGRSLKAFLTGRGRNRGSAVNAGEAASRTMSVAMSGVACSNRIMALPVMVISAELSRRGTVLNAAHSCAQTASRKP